MLCYTFCIGYIKLSYMHVYLADGVNRAFDKSGLSISRKLVNNVFLEDGVLPLPEDIFWLFSDPFSNITASCIAKIISCILGRDIPCCSTHCMATSATRHTDSSFTLSASKGSIMLPTSPLRINDLAY